MTMVLAKQFGQRILMFADTAVSGGLDQRFEPIPGQLKAIVLDGRVSLAFSGHVGRALYAARRCHTALRERGFWEAVGVLRDHSSADSGYDNAVEYVVASHLPKAELRIVRDGSISDPGEVFRLGDTNLADHILRVASDPESRRQIGEEAALSFALTHFLSDPDSPRASGVGGFPVTLLGSPYGHTYHGLASTAVFDEQFDWSTGVTASQIADRISGMREYRIRVVSSRRRGAPVVGVALTNARLAYIYSPILSDEPLKIFPLAPQGVLDVLPGDALDDPKWGEAEIRMENALKRLVEVQADRFPDIFEEPDDPLPWPDTSRRYF